MTTTTAPSPAAPFASLMPDVAVLEDAFGDVIVLATDCRGSVASAADRAMAALESLDVEIDAQLARVRDRAARLAARIASRAADLADEVKGSYALPAPVRPSLNGTHSAAKPPAIPPIGSIASRFDLTLTDCDTEGAPPQAHKEWPEVPLPEPTKPTPPLPDVVKPCPERIHEDDGGKQPDEGPPGIIEGGKASDVTPLLSDETVISVAGEVLAALASRQEAKPQATAPPPKRKRKRGK